MATMTPDRWTARPRGASFRKRLARGRPEFDDVSAVRLRAEDHDAILGRQSSSQSRLHKRRPWHTDRARVSRRMGGFTGGWGGAPPPGANPTPGGPGGSTNESTHRGPSRAALITCLSWPVVTEGSGRPTQPAHHAGESAASLPMPPGTERWMRTPKFRPAGGAKPRPCRPHGLGTSKNLPTLLAAWFTDVGLHISSGCRSPRDARVSALCFPSN
jgi:hypothetical protein